MDKIELLAAIHATHAELTTHLRRGAGRSIEPVYAS